MKFSFVVPVYNVGEYLRAGLDSLLRQTHADWEAVCVDDGSTDQSKAILEEYAAKDPRIKVLSQRNSGTVIARNHAVAETSGDYVLCVDPDDELRADALSILNDSLEREPVDVLQYGVEIIESFARTPQQRAVTERNFNPHVSSLGGEELLSAIYREQRLGWSLIFRAFRGDLARAAFAEIPDIESINETDAFALFYVASRAKGFRRIDDRLYRYRYGVGVSTKKAYGFAEYARTLGKIPCAYALLSYAGKHAAERPDMLVCAQLAAMRMVANSWSSAFLRLATGEEQRQAIALLMEKTDPELFVASLAFKFQQVTLKALEQFRRAIPIPSSDSRVRKRIGVYYYRLSQGGVQRVISLLAGKFVASGRSVTLFLDEPLTGECYALPPQVEVVYLPSPLGANHAPAWQRARALAAALRDHPVDIMYSHAYASPALVWDVLVCKLVARIPFVLHQHSVFTAMLHCSSESSHRLFFSNQMVYRWCDAVVVLSHADRMYARALGVNATYFPNPVAPELMAVQRQTGYADKGPRIVWVARMSWEKHPGDAIQIFKRVRERIPDATLTMVGGGSAQIAESLRTTLRQEGLEDAVTLTGGLADVTPEYVKASVFLTTSSIEGFPMTSLEALSHGLPIVAYAIPHLELYRGNAAVFQVAQGDIQAASEALVNVLTRDGLEELSEKAKAFARGFSSFDFVKAWDAMTESFASGSADGAVQPEEIAQMTAVYTRGAMSAVETLWRQVKARTTSEKSLKDALQGMQREMNELRRRLAEETAHCAGLRKSLAAQQAETAALKRRNDEMSREVNKMRTQAACMVREVSALGNSEAYRTGMFVTWPARKAWGGVKCLRENGLRYTAKHLVGKVARKFGFRSVKW